MITQPLVAWNRLHLHKIVQYASLLLRFCPGDERRSTWVAEGEGRGISLLVVVILLLVSAVTLPSVRMRLSPKQLLERRRCDTREDLRFGNASRRT